MTSTGSTDDDIASVCAGDVVGSKTQQKKKKAAAKAKQLELEEYAVNLRNMTTADIGVYVREAVEVGHREGGEYVIQFKRQLRQAAEVGRKTH